jgi:hypothetical protein
MSSNTCKKILSGNGMIQIPYEEYVSLMEKNEEAQRIEATRTRVLNDLTAFMNANKAMGADLPALPDHTAPASGSAKTSRQPESAHEKVSLEFSSDSEQPISKPSARDRSEAEPRPTGKIEVPPLKKEIAEHFNAQDESGRLLSVFQQYYTCLNESCGGTVRVTMKDGICSMWNYDEWEEFAFIDMIDGDLRFSLSERYTDALSFMNFCEVPRLLASRSLISIEVGDLSKTMLAVLKKAFEGVNVATQ